MQREENQETPSDIGVVSSSQSTVQDENGLKASESTVLTPNSNQTYFADEKVLIPETHEVRF